LIADYIDHDEDASGYDVSVLKLERPLQFNEFVHAAQLASFDPIDPAYRNELWVTAGIGAPRKEFKQVSEEYWRRDMSLHQANDFLGDDEN